MNELRSNDLLEFSPATQQYTWNGQLVPRVTELLRPLQDYGGISERVLDNAADRGKAVEFACQMHDLGRMHEFVFADDVLGYLRGYMAWKRDCAPVILEHQRMVFNAALRYAGTADLVSDVFDERWIIDLKATADIPGSVGPQTAAYAEAYGGKLKRAVLQLKPDGTYRWRELASRSDWPVFLACLTIYKHKHEVKHV